MALTFDTTEFVTDPQDTDSGVHAILYGPSGTGKTSTLDDDHMTVLDIDLEGGTAVLRGAPNVKRLDVPEIAYLMSKKLGKEILQFEVFMAIMSDIEAGKYADREMIAIDSFTAFEPMMQEWIAKRYVPSRSREKYANDEKVFGAQSDWKDYKAYLPRVVKQFHSFTKRRDNWHHVMWIAHSMEIYNEMTKELERTKIQLSGSSNPDVIMSVVDCYFYMYNKSIKQKDSNEYTIERGILTRQAGAYAAKARQPKRMEALPAKIVSPVWSEIFAKLGYKTRYGGDK